MSINYLVLAISMPLLDIIKRKAVAGQFGVSMHIWVIYPVTCTLLYMLHGDTVSV